MTRLDLQFRIAQLIKKYLRNNLSPEEDRELQNWLNDDENNRQLFNKITNEETLNKELLFFNELSLDKARQLVAAKTWEITKVVPIKSNTKYWRYVVAAAVIVAGFFAIYQYSMKSGSDRESVKITTEKPFITPGGNKATLQLADGSVIVLDSAANGNLTSQGNVKVIKLDGKLTYNSSNNRSEALYNTINTPRGGQYQLVLADGSQVWLNAASSIRFPVDFTEKVRKVEITGEAYFEIKKDAAKPFIVTIPGKGQVEVLGTHFNINAYDDENTLNTTLIEGSVKFIADNGESVKLKPGQQAQLSSSVSVLNDADIDKIIAWKTGWFNFDRADITTIMRQVSRWYDVEVVYEGQVSKKTFSGIVSRSQQIAEVLKIMEKAGVKFRIEGKKITVLR